MTRRILTALTLAAIAASAFGEVIQRIEVRGAHRVPARIIVDETLLREGKEYSEDEVRNAVARLNRLPFLAAADYALQNGVLVINVTEVRRFSFLVDARGIALNDDRNPHSTDYDFPDPTAEWTNAAAGVRWLAGVGGVAHFGMTVLRNRHAFGANYSAYELGYTRYDLFGTGAFATVNVRSPVDSLEEKTFTPEVDLGLPLTPSQTLTLDYQDTLFRKGTFRILGTNFRELHAERLITLAWNYDTRSQPYAPARGTFVRIAPVRWMRDDASFRSLPGRFEPTSTHINANGIDLAALRYWELSPVNSVSAGVLGGWADLENDNRRSRPAYEILQGGWSRPLASGRLAVDGRFVMHQHNTPTDENRRSYEAAASWVRRGVWGTLRLGVAYEKGN